MKGLRETYSQDIHARPTRDLWEMNCERLG